MGYSVNIVLSNVNNTGVTRESHRSIHHLYGESQVGDGDMQTVYNELLNDPYTKGILMTEIGINRSDWSPEYKAALYRNWINRQPGKLKGVTAFVAGNQASWPQYKLDTIRCGQLIGDHWST